MFCFFSVFFCSKNCGAVFLSLLPRIISVDKTHMEELKMSKKFYLDMSTARFFPPWWPENAPNLIRVVPGQYGRDWDLVMDELPKDFKMVLLDVGFGVEPSASKNCLSGSTRWLWIGSQKARVYLK
jgi:hypothetical protein